MTFDLNWTSWYVWAGSYVNGNPTNWSDPNNWDIWKYGYNIGQVAQVPPGPGDDVDIGGGTPIITGAESVAEIEVYFQLDIDGGDFTTSQCLYADLGTVSISDGGQLSVSNQSGATPYLEDDGSIDVDGAGSALNGSGSSGAIIGGSGGLHGGYGSLEIEAGASADFTTSNPTGSPLSIEDSADGNASVLVDGSGSTLTASNVIVGDGDDGGVSNLTIESGASANLTTLNSAGSSLIIGEDAADSYNNVIVQGSGSSLTATGVIVGDAGVGGGLYSGELIIQNGGAANFSNSDDSYRGLTIGYQGSFGTVTVDGAGSSLTVGDGGLSVGDAGQGSLTVSDGATLDVTDTTYGLVIGTQDGSTGTVNITGEGSTLNSVGPILMAEGNQSTSTITVTGNGASLIDTDELVVGEQGSAQVTVSQGANVSIGSQNDLSQYDSLYLGAQSNSAGTMTVTDADTTVSVNGQVDVGLAGIGHLTLQNGATMTTGDATSGTAEGIDIGGGMGGTGTFIVQDQNTQLTNTGLIIVGEDGNGTFTIANGAQVTTSINADLQTSGFDVATGKGSTGTVNITGANTSLTATDIDLDSQGAATVTVANGAQVTDSGDFKLAPQDGGNVQFTVTGSNTLLSVNGTATVGGTGKSTATLNIQNNATFDPPADLIIAPNAAPTAQTPMTDPVTGFRLDYIQAVNVNGGATLHANQITVGQAGNGGLIVAGGTIIADDTLTIGDKAGSQGQLLLDGNDSSLQSLDVTVGNSGKGLLSIGNGNVVTTDGDATIGAEASGSGFVTVGDGSGTSIEGADWTISGSLTVGDSGSGTLTVTPASSLEVGSDMVIGGQSGGSGHVTFTDGSLSMGGTITVGDQGGGSLVFQTGATMNGGAGLQVPSVVIGETLGISGSMSVTDAGTSVEVQNLTVGEAGAGSLSVKAGGTLLVDGTADVGADAIGAIQKLTLDTGGTMSVTGDLTLGTAAAASVSIKDGAQLAGASNVVLGDESGGGAGIVTVSGVSGAPGNTTPSGLGYGLKLTIGNNGIGNLTISSGALVAPTPGGNGDIEVAARSGSQGTVTLSGSGSALKGDTLSLGGTDTAVGGLAKLAIGSGARVTIADSAHLWSTAKVTLSGGGFSAGTLTIDKGAAVSGFGTLSGNVTDDGSIAASGGLLDISGDVSGSGTLTIGSGASIDLGDSVEGVKIQFKGTGDTLQLSDSTDVTSTIAGFNFGDTIELDGVTATSAADANGMLDVYDGTSMIASFAVSGDYKGAIFDVATNTQGSSITLDATQPNGLPTITVNDVDAIAPANTEVAAGSAVPLSGLTVSDSTSGAAITVEVLTGSGELAANTGGSGGGGTITVAPDQTALIISGTVSQVNADLATVTYTATTSGIDTLQLVATDNLNNSDEDSETITVLDQAPVLTLPSSPRLSG